MNPKLCECGIQGAILDSRQRERHILRRYKCRVCKKRWSTCELRLDEGADVAGLEAAMIKKFSTVDRDYVADKLIALAQELLHGKSTYPIC